MKKALCLFFAVLLCCGALSVPSFSAGEETPAEGLTIGSAQLTAAQTASAGCGARYSASEDDRWAEARQEIVLRDDYVFPDRFNTGHVTEKEELTEFSQKYPEVESRYYQRSWGGVDHSYTTYYITEKTAALYQYCFEGFYVKNAGFTFSNTSEVLMRDFLLEAGSDVRCGIRTALSESQGRVYLCDAELTGSVSAMIYGYNVTALRCYLHDIYADHAKGFSGQRYVSCYFSLGGLNGGNPHPDCLQISGDDSHGGPMDAGDILLYGNRLDAMPTSATATNSCIIIKSEFGAGLRNIQIRRNWINGGNCPVQIGCGSAEMDYYTGVSVSDNYFGCGVNATFSFTSAYADQLKKNGTFSGNRKVNAPEVGSILLLADGRRVSSADGLAGKEVSVAVTLSNYASAGAEGYIRISLCDAAGRVLAFSDTPFAIEGLKPQSETKKISGFSYEMQPLDRVYTASLPAGEPEEGGFYAISVVALGYGGAADILRSTALTADGAAKAHDLTLPAGYLPVERNPEAPSSQFIKAVGACADVTGEDLRQFIVSAFALWGGADDNVHGVIAAKKALNNYLTQFNTAAGAANEAADRGFAILRRMTPAMQKTGARLARILCRLYRPVPFAVKGGSIL